MIEKNKYSRSDMRAMFLLGCLFIVMVASIIWLPEINKARSERNAAMNFAADLWCQDQTYGALLVTKPDGTTETLQEGEFLYGVCSFNATAETHHFATGRFLANESKIECLGEPLYNNNNCAIAIDGTCYATYEKPEYYQKSQKFEVPEM